MAIFEIFGLVAPMGWDRFTFLRGLLPWPSERSEPKLQKVPFFGIFRVLLPGPGRESHVFMTLPRPYEPRIAIFAKITLLGSQILCQNCVFRYTEIFIENFESKILSKNASKSSPARAQPQILSKDEAIW